MCCATTCTGRCTTGNSCSSSTRGSNSHRSAVARRSITRTSPRWRCFRGCKRGGTCASVADASTAMVLSPEEKEYYREVGGGSDDALNRAAPSDFYELMGLEIDATQEQVKQAYRRLQRIMHPDIVGERSKSRLEVLDGC